MGTSVADRVDGIVFVSFFAATFYVPGLLYQRYCRVSHSKDISVQKLGDWKYWFGVKAADRICLRPAFVQGIAMLYFVLGVGGVLLYGKSVIEPLTTWILAGGLMIFGVVGFGIDMWKRLRGD